MEQDFLDIQYCIEGNTVGKLYLKIRLDNQANEMGN